jgi:hypothetical protein
VATFRIQGSFYVLVRDREGRVLLRSAESRDEAACRELAARIRSHATEAQRFERRRATNGGMFFVLCDDTGAMIARSPTFDSQAAIDRAITEVRRVVTASSADAR